MVSEDFVSFNIMRFLQKNGWIIVQYHPPGGQASFSVNVSGESFYPDLIAYKDSQILVMENKPNYNSDDVDKLRKIMSSEEAKIRIIEHVTHFCKDHSFDVSNTFIFRWAHAFSGEPHPDPLQNINLMYVQDAGIVQVTQSVENRLRI